MTYYCRLHPDFEGLNIGQLNDHMERDHPEIKTAAGNDFKKIKQAFADFYKQNIQQEVFRRSDGVMINRSWGRPPTVGNFMGDNQKESAR